MYIIARLIGYASQYRGRLLVAFAFVFISTAMYVAIPRLLGMSIDTALTSGRSTQLLALSAAILAISLTRGLSSYGQSYFVESISQLAAYDLRNALYDKLQNLSFAYHDRQHTGDLMSKATADVENVRWFFSIGLIRSVYLILLVVTVGGLLLTMNWKLGLITLGFILIIAIRAVYSSKRLRNLWFQVQKSTGEMTTALQENLSGIKVVKAFAAEDHEMAQFQNRANKMAEDSYQANRLFGFNSSLMTMIFTSAIGAILWFGGKEVIAERLTPGQLAQFIFYMGILAMPVRMTGWLVNVFTRAASSGQRIFEILDVQSPVKECPTPMNPGSLLGNVSFENVFFSYDDGVPLLHDISFEVRSGQRVAFLGAPGSGKSTIAHLLPRFYDVTAGRITIDGIDTRNMSLASLRENIGIVQQDVFLFNASIHENIAYGKPSASRQEVVYAAQTAQLHEFIESLPHDYESRVNERGVNLSGGQRQRLAIARALLLNPPVLIFDDSTSSVDAPTEQLLQRVLKTVMRGRTTFTIAHRLTSVQDADQILVLDKGRIVERGTHQQLLQQGTLYKRIYNLQIQLRQPLSTQETRSTIPKGVI
jgi:ABC-type multidrug transport system fused ATPase/permease subunit